MARKTTRSTRTTTRKSGGLKQYLFPAAIGGALLWWLWPKKANPMDQQTNGGDVIVPPPPPPDDVIPPPPPPPPPDENPHPPARAIAVPIPPGGPGITAYSFRVNGTRVALRGAPINGEVLYRLNTPDRVIAPDFEEAAGDADTGAWIGVIDPVNRQRGWISAQYLDDRRVAPVGADGNAYIPNSAEGNAQVPNRGGTTLRGYAYPNGVRQPAVAGYGWRTPRTGQEGPSYQPALIGLFIPEIPLLTATLAQREAWGAAYGAYNRAITAARRGTPQRFVDGLFNRYVNTLRNAGLIAYAVEQRPVTGAPIPARRLGRARPVV